MASQQELTDARNARFLELLEPIYKDCERWAYSRVQNQTDAEDVLSQSILTGLTSFHQLKNEGAFKTWMFRIISNTHRLLIRSNKKHPDALDPEIMAAVASPVEDWTQQDASSQEVRQALMQLSDEQRQGLVLFEMFDFSIREVAEVMGKNEGAVRVLLHRSRDRFKAVLVNMRKDNA